MKPTKSLTFRRGSKGCHGNPSILALLLPLFFGLNFLPKTSDLSGCFWSSREAERTNTASTRIERTEESLWFAKCREDVKSTIKRVFLPKFFPVSFSLKRYQDPKGKDRLPFPPFFRGYVKLQGCSPLELLINTLWYKTIVFTEKKHSKYSQLGLRGETLLFGKLDETTSVIWAKCVFFTCWGKQWAGSPVYPGRSLTR